MRPEILFPLFAPLTALKGVGAQTAALLEKVAGGNLVRDLAFLAPHGAIDRRRLVPIAEAQGDEIATIEAEVDAHAPARNPKTPYKVRLRDETGFLTLAFFHAKAEYLQRLLPVGAKRIVSGKVEIYGGERQMLHPDHVVDPARAEDLPLVEPVYPLTQGLSGKVAFRAVREAIGRTPQMPEWLDPGILSHRAWPDFRTALGALHAPSEPADLDQSGPARTRLAYDELFLRQCALRLRRAQRRALSGEALEAPGAKARAILDTLPFKPTGAQIRAFSDIRADLQRPDPMLRMLQGDVGSGKTLVAALAMAHAAEAGRQSALMAPTEILARQHAATLAPLLQAAGLRFCALTGRDKAAQRREILSGLKRGDIHAVVGTHALFQDDVEFFRLGLVVIDEQHRFGVSDRERLVAKGKEPHVLVMSATPIPRSLALAVHGDMDLSILDEKPPGRIRPTTNAMPLERLSDAVEAAGRAIARDDRVYWVCPLVEESEQIDLAAASERHAALAARFPGKVGLVHGRMPATERDRELERFRSGEFKILVATTVIEVGVNVPEAVIMVIEHADRFGLAQLHQLRGRVGRGEKPAHCVLLYQAPLSEAGQVRLNALRRSDDGFEIAEIDYKLRGAGDVLGVRQSGFPPLRFVSPAVHGDMLAAADRDARLAIDRDPDLASPRGQAIAIGLALFQRETGADARSG